MAGIRTLQTAPGASAAVGIITQADIDAVKYRTLLSDNVLADDVASIDLTTIFTDNPSYEFFDFEFVGNHNYNTTNYLNLRYFDNGFEYSAANHHYNNSEVWYSTTSGGSGTTQTKFELTQTGFSATQNFTAAIRFYPNNPIVRGNSNSQGGVHSFRAKIGMFSQSNRFIYFVGGGFNQGAAPAIASGFKFYLNNSSFSTGSIARVYGVNSAGTVLI